MVFTAHQSPSEQRLLKRFSTRKDDSPSRQLQFDLERALGQLIIREHEVTKVHAYQRRTYHEELEARDSARIKAHTAAIDAAKAKHEAVREEAELALRLHLKEQEEQRQRKEEEERQRREREAREKAERERKAREEVERKEREERERKEAEEAKIRQAAEEKSRIEAETAARKEREATAQKEKAERDQAERERLAKEAASKAQSDKEAAQEKAHLEQQERDKQAANAKAKANAVPAGSGFYSASPEAEETHKIYLNLHRKLKQFRKDFWEQAKQNKPLKAVIGDMRRAMRTSVGQLTEDKAGNRKAIERVKTAINQSLTTIPSPKVKINDYLPPSQHLTDTSKEIPSLTIYLLSIFSKAVIAAFATEAAVNPRAAEPVGTLAAQVFSLSELQFDNPTQPAGFTSLISILISKFHRVTPILFGVSGPESTVQGRLRLGWRMEGEEDKKQYVPDQRHFERMTGLGAGYASISLRNFSKAKLRNPFPPTNFWKSLAYVVNTPAEHVTTSHLLLLKSMLDNNALDRFVLFFGSVAVAALREALVAFPSRLPETMRKSAAARNLEIMVDALAAEKHFRLN